jgi:adenosylcobinamide-GDP ribazoletransferase
VRSARQALGFLTIAGSASTPTAAALMWFPVVGALIGAAVGGLWWAAASWFPVLVAASLAVIADLVITGMLHVDGLADSADGLLPHLDRTRRLEVMATPDVGAFGVSTVAATLLLRWVALAAMAPSVPLLAALWCASRTAMAVTTLTQPYVGGGLATAFLPPPAARRSLATLVGSGGLIASVVLVACWRVGPGLVTLATLTVTVVGVVALARRRIGGFTGDVLGAAGMVAETLGLVVASARW